MSDGIIVIGCGAMLVENTGYGARADRMARELPCTKQTWEPEKPGEPVNPVLPGTCYGFVQINGVRYPLPVKEVSRDYFRFPKTRIRNIRKGVWEAESITAWGAGISIKYPEEPILRVGGLLDGHMEAMPISNEIESSWIRVNGVRYSIYAPLPLAPADPGPFFGLFSYTVRPVTIRGTLMRV